MPGRGEGCGGGWEVGGGGGGSYGLSDYLACCQVW